MTDEDLPFVARLYASTRAQEVAAMGWPAETQHAFLDQQHRAQHQHYRSAYSGAEWLIIERGAEAIGRLYIADAGAQLHLIDISLLTEERGKGLGGAILADLLGHAAAQNKGIELHVETFNPARRLYRRLGFAVVGDQGIYQRMEWRPEPASA